MLIKKRPIISILLDKNYIQKTKDIIIPGDFFQPISRDLDNAFNQLEHTSKNEATWGLPEMLMPSFEDVMQKSCDSFSKIYHQLVHEFNNECGILLSCRNNVTIVYRFQNDIIYIWLFDEHKESSLLFAYYQVVLSEVNQRRINAHPELIKENHVLGGTREENLEYLYNVADNIVIYLAVKKYVEVETVVVPVGKFTAVGGTPLEYVDKKKVINNTGQEVIVMDSKWFRKIINDNDIFVRGFFRMQNKKNAEGEWYKELIFVNPFVRHGYHRDAKIENEPENQ